MAELYMGCFIAAFKFATGNQTDSILFTPANIIRIKSGFSTNSTTPVSLYFIIIIRPVVVYSVVFGTVIKVVFGTVIKVNSIEHFMPTTKSFKYSNFFIGV